MANPLDDVPTIHPYRIATAHNIQYGAALLVIPKSTPAFALPVDIAQIRVIRGLLDDLEKLLVDRSGNA